jgi:hypothetical protein
MPTDHRAKLASIKRFDQLIAYLRDEMGWPIAKESFENVDDLFYDFTTEELGIDPKTAPSIQEIKRLRPLSTNQPWGIFFIKFAPKRLPVVALRRILSRVALKKRPSAKSAERAAWAADDLLFISNYGEGEERQISFAHFARPQNSRDLPTLKVISWDDRDTAVHLDTVASELTRQLAWPDEESDSESWRNRWRSAFTLRHREVITTAKQLALRLAKLAKDIHDQIEGALELEEGTGPLTQLMKEFQRALVHDLDSASFADMYAQTIAYGLLSARIADPSTRTADDFTAHMRTNPLLRELLEEFLRVGGRRSRVGGPGIDFDELGVSDVVDLLNSPDTHMQAVLGDFGDKNPQEDPVIHFYQDFLQAYDSELRVRRGVFYTPRPVVSYIVRSVDELLRTEFGLADGLADTTTWGEMAKRHTSLKIPEGVSPDQDFVQILDPATGTGTFLVEVIDVIHKTLVAKWKAQGQSERQIEALWNEYVPKHLLTRLHGYELLMAPYAIAHLKVGLKLHETGYRFGSDERAQVYLTNALEPALDVAAQFAFAIPALAHEARAVNSVKEKRRFTVILGNPPYSISSQNAGPWISRLTDSYKQAVRHERNIQPLSDDYVKFIRLGQHAVGESRAGILAYISNHTFLSGLIHRGMREELLKHFARASILDLNGSALLGLGLAPDGRPDQNVFDIQQGVAISAFWTSPDATLSMNVGFASIRTDRSRKYAFLSAAHCLSGGDEELSPLPPNYFFVPSATRDSNYDEWPSLDSIFLSQSTGLETGRDDALIGFDREKIQALCADLHSQSFSAAQLARKYSIGDTSGWPVSTRRRDIQRVLLGQLVDTIRLIEYRPFDKRFSLYGKFLRRAQFENMRHMLSNNLGLVATRMIKGEAPAHLFATREPIEKILLSPKTSNNAFLFPLYVDMEDSASRQVSFADSRELNFRQDFLDTLAVGLSLKPTGHYGLPAGVTPEDIFHYIYAVLSSPSYRERYSAFLKSDFARLPLTGSVNLFRALARIGSELVALHLLESPKLDDPISELVGANDWEVERISWSKNTVWLDKAQSTGFKNVDEEVWNFHIGGYQVCKKWLKDRRGRRLSKDDIVHYEKIVVALSETIRLMKEIDEIVEKHGGWPGAFQLGAAAVASGAAGADVVPIKRPAPQYERPSVPVRKVAERHPASGSEEADSDAPEDDSTRGAGGVLDLETNELMCRLRSSFATGGLRDRETAMRQLAEDCGHSRLGPRIREAADNAIRTAVRRGVLDNEGGELELCAPSIEGFDREFLKEQFLASLEGYDWEDREESIRHFARWMGFRRTGKSIAKVAKSLINGLLRQGRLVKDGSSVRRSS